MDMPPQLQGDEHDAQQLRQYLVRLVDRLLYTLNHLDSENVVEGGISVGKIAGGGAAVLRDASQQTGNGSNGGPLSTSHLRAQVAEIVTAVIKTAKIDWAHIADLEAEMAEIAEATIGTATIDWAHIQKVIGETVIGTRFLGEKMFIDQLGVTSAQMVDLTVGTLCIRAADGKYYTLNVNPGSGFVTATETTVTDGEIDAGITQSGKHIIETDLTAAELNASHITAVEALIDKLTAKRIDVDELFARQATLNAITTGRIASQLGKVLNLESNTSIQAMVSNQEAEIEALRELVASLTVGLGEIRMDVADLEGRYGTHILVDSGGVSITQDQAGEYLARITAERLAFISKTTGAEWAGFGVSGGYAERLRVLKFLSIGTDANGWYDMTSLPSGMADKWRDGSESTEGLLITREPADCVVTLGSGSHPLDTALDWSETATFTAEADGAAGYAWQACPRGQESWTDLAETGAQLTVALSRDRIGMLFRCKVTGTDGSVLYTQAARIRVQGAPVALRQPDTQEINIGDSATVTIPAAGASAWTWQHRSGDTAAGAWANDADNPQAGSKTYPAESADRTLYGRCVLTAADGSMTATDEFVIRWS